MRTRIYRSIVSRLVAVALVAAGSIGFGVGVPAASAAGTTPQTITFGPLPSTSGVNFTYLFNARASSGLPVDVLVEGPPAPACFASSTEFFTVERIGTCLITFSQPGDATYAPAPEVTFTMTITGASNVITVSPAVNMQIGQTQQIVASTSSGLPIQYNAVIVGGQQVCSISSTGLVTGLAAGTCSIRLDSAGTGTYVSAAPVTRNFAVTKRNQAALVLSAPTALNPGDAAAISVSGGSGTGATSISVTGDCSLTGLNLTANSSGTSCTVSATKAADDQYQSAVATQTVRIMSASTGGGTSGGGSSGGGSGTGPVASTDVLPEFSFVIDEEATKKAKPSLDAKDVSSVTGGVVIFKGSRLNTIEQVFLGGTIPVKILSSTVNSIELELPKASLVGLQALRLLTAEGEKIFEDAIQYLAAPPALKAVTKVLKGFKSNQTALSKTQKLALKSFVKSIGAYKMVECRGLTKPIYLTCRYLKVIYKAGRVKVTKLKLKANSATAKQVRLVFSR